MEARSIQRWLQFNSLSERVMLCFSITGYGIHNIIISAWAVTTKVKSPNSILSIFIYKTMCVGLQNFT